MLWFVFLLCNPLRLIRFFIVDIDECSHENGSCEDVCVNLEGSYECQCGVGYQIFNNRQCVGKTVTFFATLLF